MYDQHKLSTAACSQKKFTQILQKHLIFLLSQTKILSHP